MKFTATITAVIVTLASVGEVAAAIPPFCALTCFNSVMNHPAAKTCTEANMYLCMCKIPVLTQTFRSCVCSTCSTVSTQKAAIKYGKDTCVEQGAPLVNFPDQC